MKYASYEEVREELSQARQETLARCVRRANEEECDLFVVAGDLFERTNVSRDTVLSAVDALSKFEGKAVLVLPGNHDFFLGIDSRPWSYFYRQSELHGDRIVLLFDERKYDLGHFDLPMSILPAPCRAKHSQTSGLGWMPRGEPNQTSGDRELTIGIAHGSIEGISPDYDGRYFPMNIRELESIAADFWLVGHTHRSHPHGEGDLRPKLLIPGTPEPDGFSCTHTGRAWIVEVEDYSVSSYRAIDTGTYQFVDIDGEFSNLSSLQDAVKPYENMRALLRITAGGTFAREEHAALQDFIGVIRKKVFYLRSDFSGLTERIDAELVNEEFTTDSFPHRLLSTLLEQKDPQAAQIAYHLLQSTRT